MQDNEVIYRIELTKDELEYLEKAKNEYLDFLSQMTKEERLQHFKEKYNIENNLNFEKEIKGTIYQVKYFFNDNSNETIINKVDRLLGKESWGLLLFKVEYDILGVL